MQYTDRVQLALMQKSLSALEALKLSCSDSSLLLQGGLVSSVTSNHSALLVNEIWGDTYPFS